MATLGDEVERRAGRLGLSLSDVARRMGVTSAALTHAFTYESLSEGWFRRLCNALEMRPADWSEPLSEPPSEIERVREMRARTAAVYYGTEKTRPRKKEGGGSRSSC